MQLPKFLRQFDKVTLTYYLEQADLELNQESIDLIQQYIDMGFSLERAIQTTAGILKTNN